MRSLVRFPRIVEFLPHRHWQQQPGVESRCPVDLFIRAPRREIRMEHGRYEDFNRGRSVFGFFRVGLDRRGDQHRQLVRDGRQAAPGALQELFQQKERPGLHLHL